ncbi:hypothetical protein GOV11_02425 [Candidatus Woesearchaeota archaeon]|nr:hypothetical protein [Candidatus Woesearchaeota archaeon]
MSSEQFYRAMTEDTAACEDYCDLFSSRTGALIESVIYTPTSDIYFNHLRSNRPHLLEKGTLLHFGEPEPIAMFMYDKDLIGTKTPIEICITSGAFQNLRPTAEIELVSTVLEYLLTMSIHTYHGIRLPSSEKLFNPELKSANPLLVKDFLMTYGASNHALYASSRKELMKTPTMEHSRTLFNRAYLEAYMIEPSSDVDDKIKKGILARWPPSIMEEVFEDLEVN